MKRINKKRLGSGAGLSSRSVDAYPGFRRRLLRAYFVVLIGSLAAPAFAVIPSLIGPLQALLGLVPQILLAIAAAFTALFSIRTWRLRTQQAARAAARHKTFVAGMIFGFMAVGYGGWKIYEYRVEANAMRGQRAPLPEPPSRVEPIVPSTNSLPTPSVAPATPNTLLPPPRLAWKISNSQADFASSPTVRGPLVYLAAGQASALGSRSGFVACVRAEDGQEIWRFPTERQVFSSPAVAGDAVLVGEGLHMDQQANLYCLDAPSGRLRWKFPVNSHVESSPVVREDRVYFGAGDAGVYCVELATGRQLWHHGGWHVDSRPAIAEGKIVVGSGYDPLTIACLDAAQGTVLWEFTPELPAWGEPRIINGRVLIGLGNGDFDRPASYPAGAMVALNLKDGAPLWRQDLPDSVFTAVAAENDQGFFGCRDGNLYAVDLVSGKILWKQSVGAPILSTPLLVGGMILFGANNGEVVSLSAKDGKPLWKFNARPFANFGARILSSPAWADGRLYIGVSAGCFLALTDLGSS